MRGDRRFKTYFSEEEIEENYAGRAYYEVSWLLDKLFVAFLEARKNKRGTVSEAKYDRVALVLVADLCQRIEDRVYKPSASVAFITNKPTVREIFAAPFCDRVVHHFLSEMQAGWWERRFIRDSYSCIKGRGTLDGVQRLEAQIRKASRNYTKDVYVRKWDLQGYFMSLPRKKLYERIVWGLRRQYKKGSYEYCLCEYLWRVVIMDNPTRRARIKGSERDWEALPESKSLFCAGRGKGIVIGNLTSQLVSNIYLDLLDRYMKYGLECKYYGRYVDDFYVVSESREWLEGLDSKIEEFCESIGVKLHPKKRRTFAARGGVPYLGVIVYYHHIQPGKRLANGFRYAARRVARGEKGAEISLRSYIGLMSHVRHEKLVSEVLGDDLSERRGMASSA